MQNSVKEANLIDMPDIDKLLTLTSSQEIQSHLDLNLNKKRKIIEITGGPVIYNEHNPKKQL